MRQQQGTMRRVRPINYVAFVEIVVLSGTAALLTVKWLRGTLDLYIHPRYTILVLLATLVLFLMGGVRLRDLFVPRAKQRLTAMHLLLALPLLVGIVVPAQPLDADTLVAQGLDPTRVQFPGQRQPGGNPATWNLLQWATELAVQDDRLQGEPVDVVGFVFPDERLGSDSFYVVRYVVTCCAADGSAVGLPVRWEGGQALAANTWVRVQGTLDAVTRDGMRVPGIAATIVEPVDEPDVPYLFP